MIRRRLFLIITALVLYSIGACGTEFTVVTFNTEWLFDGLNESYWSAPQSPEIANAHLRDVATLLAKYDADFIALQEVEDRNMLSRLATLLGEDYELVFIEGNDQTGQNVCALSRYPILDSGRTSESAAFPIPDSTLSCSSGRMSVAKNFWVHLDIDGTLLTIIDAHFVPWTFDCDRAMQREAQAVVLRNLAIDTGLNLGREVIILGDLNDYDTAVPDHSGSVSLSMAVSILKDLDSDSPGDELLNATKLLPQVERYSAWWDRDEDGYDDGGNERTQIDHILVSERLYGQITNVWIDHSFPAGAVSDHWPIIVTFNLPEAVPISNAPVNSAGETGQAEEVVRQVLSYVSSPDVMFYCEGSTDMSDSEFWGRPGSQVRDVVVTMREGQFELGVQLNTGSSFELYKYSILYCIGDEEVHITLDPANETAEFATATPTGWIVNARYTGDALTITDNYISIKAPNAAFGDPNIVKKLRHLVPDLLLTYYLNGRSEFFTYPRTAAGGLLSRGAAKTQTSELPQPALDSPMRGIHIGGSFNHGGGMNGLLELPEEYFLYLKSLNVNWVGIAPAGGGLQDAWDTSFPGIDISEVLLRRLCRKLREHDFRVYIAVSAWFWHFGEAWPDRGSLGAQEVLEWNRFPGDEDWPWDPTLARHEYFVEEFFQSYQREIVRLAALCEDEGVEMLALGSETDWLFRTRDEHGQLDTEYRDELQRMIQQVRRSYSGLLTYDMHYSDLYGSDLRENSIELWGDLDLDVIGLSMYPRLFEVSPDGVPSVSELVERWQRIFDSDLLPIRHRYPDKPIVFTEFGFMNAVGTTYEDAVGKEDTGQLADENANGLDDGEEEQANAIEALFKVLDANPGIVDGVFIWGEKIETVQDWSDVRAVQRDHWFRGHLAQEVICEAYGSLAGLGTSEIQACCICPAAPDSQIASSDEQSALTDEPRAEATQLEPDSEADMTKYPVEVLWGGTYGHAREVAFSPDGNLLAVAGYDQYCRLYSFTEGVFTDQAFRHPRLIMGAEFSPDGRLLATAGSDQLVRIWDIQANEQLHALAGHPHYVRALSFSPDGKRLASAGDDSSIRVWDTQSGEAIATLQRHAHWGDIAYSPDGKALLAASDNGSTSVWDASSFELIDTLEGHSDYVYTIVFSGNGKILATGERSGRVKVWSWPDKNCLLTLESAGGFSLSLDTFGELLVATDRTTGAVGVWEISTGDKLRELEATSRVMNLAFSPDGTTIVASLENGQLQAWDACTGATSLVNTYHTDFVTGIEVHGNEIVSVGWDGLALIWADNSARASTEFAVRGEAALCMSMSPVSQLVAIGREDGSIQLIVAATKEAIWSANVDTSAIQSLEWTSDGALVVWGSHAGNVGSVVSSHPFSSRHIFSFEHSVFAICQAPFSGDLAIGLSDGTISTVSLSGEQLSAFQGHEDSVYSLDFDSSGTRLFSGGRDGTIRAWDLPVLEDCEIVGEHDGSVYEVLYLDDQGLLVSASADSTIGVWDPDSSQRLSVLAGHSSGVMALCWDVKNSRLISGSRGDVMIWDSCSLLSNEECATHLNPYAAVEQARAPRLEAWSASILQVASDASGEDAAPDESAASAAVRSEELPLQDILLVPGKMGGEMVEDGAVFQMGMRLQGIEQVDGVLYVLDWESGVLYAIARDDELYWRVDTGMSRVCDLASDSDKLWLVDESGRTMTYGLNSHLLSDVAQDAPLDGEVLGAAFDNGMLLLLVYQADGPKLCQIPSGGAVTWFDVAGSGHGELIGLQWAGTGPSKNLITLDYANRTILRLHGEGDEYVLSPYINVQDYLPAQDALEGALRGFFMSEDLWFFSYIGTEGSLGKLVVIADREETAP